MACMKLNCIIQCLLALEFLLLPTFDPLHLMAQGRPFSKLSENTMRIDEEEKMVIMRGMIGSKPPRCDKQRHCEAVQVPIVATNYKKEFIIKNHFINFPKINSYYRGDYISNYKPMCWKCKCGDFFFNP